MLCAMRPHAFLFLAALALSETAAVGQTARNLSLQARLPRTACTTGDVWAIGDYMLLARRSQGFEVVDARDPKNIKTKLVRPPGYPQSVRSYGVGDIKADDRYIYATNEGTSVGGVFVYDARDPMNPRYVGVVGSGHGTVHNCWIDPRRKLLYTNRGWVYDVTNPAAPRTVSRPVTRFCHDVMAAGNRAYYSLWYGGFAIYDMTSPSRPRLLASHSYSGARTHNAWPTEDGKFLYTTDEKADGFVRIWDISNLSAIRQVGTWRTGARGESVHNVQVAGDLLFVTYYKSGLRVLSIKDPARPVEIAFFDDYPGTGPGCFGGPYAGTWGVYPWHFFQIFVSDLDKGGYVLRLDAVPGTFTAKSTTVRPGQILEMDLGYRNATNTSLGGFGVVVFSAINNQPLLVEVLSSLTRLAPAQVVGKKIRLPVPPGIPALTVDFTAYTGTFDPILVSSRIPLRVNVR